MEILEVTASEYAKIISAPYHVFASVAFNNLNSNKCDEVYYILFREGKFRLGIIGGKKENVFYSPFSAPYGGFTFLSDNIRLQYIEDAIKLLTLWATEKGISAIKITLPPSIYESNFNARQINCLWRQGFEISEVDLNYSFDLDSFDEKYSERIWYNARKNLKIAMHSDLKFFKCTIEKEKTLAYDIICKNRESRGYPLRLSWKQVSDTIQIIKDDFFIVNDAINNSIASAMVFHIAKNIVQIIYWGDNPEYSKLKTMNFLSFKVFEYYKNQGIHTIDIGPSTENSVPNYGLAEFKESIGCMINPKYTFTKILN